MRFSIVDASVVFSPVPRSFSFAVPFVYLMKTWGKQKQMEATVKNNGCSKGLGHWLLGKRVLGEEGASHPDARGLSHPKQQQRIASKNHQCPLYGQRISGKPMARHWQLIARLSRPLVSALRNPL